MRRRRADAVAADEGKEEYTAPGATKTVLKEQIGLASGDDLEMRAIRFELPAGFVGGRHYHTGDLMVYVQSGALEVETADGSRTVKAGEVYYETPGEAMVGKNAMADGETVLIVFQVGHQGEPLMVKVKGE